MKKLISRSITTLTAITASLTFLNLNSVLAASLLLVPGDNPLDKRSANQGDIIPFNVTYDPMRGAAKGDLTGENIDFIRFNISLFDELSLIPNSFTSAGDITTFGQATVRVNVPLTKNPAPIYGNILNPVLIASFKTLVFRKPIDDDKPDIILDDASVTVERLGFDPRISIDTPNKLSVIPISEYTSTSSFLALGLLGAASTFFRKQNLKKH